MTIITIYYPLGNSGSADPGLEPHLRAVGVAGVDPDRLHLAAARTRSGLDALLLQQVPPQHHQVRHWLIIVFGHLKL